MEQQYTCPFCHKDYTRFTIHEHYVCGVFPLEPPKVVSSPDGTMYIDKLRDAEGLPIEIEQELDEISEEVAEQKQSEYGEPTESDSEELAEQDEQFITYAPVGKDGAFVKVENSKEFDDGSGTLAFLQGGGDADKIADSASNKPEPKKRGRKPKAK